jgi:hypothetical protein
MTMRRTVTTLFIATLLGLMFLVQFPKPAAFDTKAAAIEQARLEALLRNAGPLEDCEVVRHRWEAMRRLLCNGPCNRPGDAEMPACSPSPFSKRR